MKPADWHSLQDKIIRPDIDKHLVPLLLYRGCRGMGDTVRKWNFAILCMESEVLTYTQAVKLSHNPDFVHLCNSVKKIDHGYLGSIFGRLIDNPDVTGNVKGLTEYVREVEGIKHKLTRVSLYTNDPAHPERGAAWRIKDFSPEIKLQRELQRRARKPGRPPKDHFDSMIREPVALEFPFMMHKPHEAESNLLADIHGAIPADWPSSLRADFCQDLVTGILSGDMQPDVLEEPRAFVPLVLAAHPLKYGRFPAASLISGAP